MNTDKLNTIDEDALDNVAGGSLVGAVGDLVEAGVGLGKSNFESGLKFAQDQWDNWETYVGKVRKALFGA
jgi:hypothetical protein